MDGTTFTETDTTTCWVSRKNFDHLNRGGTITVAKRTLGGATARKGLPVVVQTKQCPLKIKGTIIDESPCGNWTVGKA